MKGLKTFGIKNAFKILFAKTFFNRLAMKVERLWDEGF